MSAHGAAWFAHRLDSWSKIAREKVKRAADLNNESPTNTSDDGSTSTISIQKDNSKDTSKSASSSFEVSGLHLKHPTVLNIDTFNRDSLRTLVLKDRHRPHLPSLPLYIIKVNHFRRGI